MKKTNTERKAQFLFQLLKYLFEELPSTETEDKEQETTDSNYVGLYYTNASENILIDLNGQLFFYTTN